MQTDEDKLLNLERAILAYLSRRPNAQDTAEGVAMFWLAQQRVEESVTDVVRVLDRLVERGTLERLEHMKGVDSRGPLYRLRRGNAH